nr:aminotransferase class I/II-fold pyridoxal phosphate-dependent enzyme [Candidatus Electrothrix aestuarii]
MACPGCGWASASCTGRSPPAPSNRQPFNINLPAQAGALAALSDTEHYAKTMTGTAAGREWLSEQVRDLGCVPYPSCTNFFLIDVQGDATALYDAMLYKGVIVRSMKTYGYPYFIRITIGTEQENQRFVAALKDCLKELGHVYGQGVSRKNCGSSPLTAPLG